MAASELLQTTLERGIAESSNIISNAMVANHTSQLNNFARCAEVLSKRISEWDGPEAIAGAEGYTRFSPASQVHHAAVSMAELSGVMQNNQNQVAQGFLQLQASIEGLKSAILASK
jgi:hypothetical protein